MVTDGQILEAVEALGSEHRTATIETLSERLGVDDVAELESKLGRLARTGKLWMTTWWWTAKADEQTQWSYWPRRGDDPTVDLTG
jgi:hypothetical protein